MPPEHPEMCVHCASYSQVFQYRNSHFCMGCEDTFLIISHRDRHMKYMHKLEKERYEAHFAFSKRVIERGLAA